MKRMHLPNVRHRALAILALFSALAACGGGGGAGGATLPTTPQSTPSSSVPQPYSLNTITGVSGVASGSATAYASAAVTVSASASSPTGVAVRHRATDSQTALVYFSIAANAGSAFVTEFKASLTLASAASGTVSLSQWENGAWAGTDATVTVSGSTVSFDYSINPGAAAPVYFALYTGAALPTPSPTPTPTSTPTSTPTATPTATATPTTAPSAAANSCSQTPQPGTQAGGVSDNPSGFFSALEASKQACVSVYEPSSQLQTALVYAATHGSAVTVIFPAEEYTSDESDASTLAADGAHVIWLQDTQSPEYVISATPAAEYITDSYLPIHAKFALVDGVAYLDGHNWFGTNPADVILQDANAADYTAMQTELTTFPSSPPTVSGSNYLFTTDKYNSLNEEAAVLNAAGVSSGYTVDFISESFLDYGASAPEGVFSALLAAAKAGATVNVIVEGTITSSYETCALSILAYNGAKVYVQTYSGSQKILLILNGSTVTNAWIGSSNMTDYDYIDWGMTIPTTDTSVISAIQSNYSTYMGYASPSPAPAASPTCST